MKKAWIQIAAGLLFVAGCQGPDFKGKVLLDPNPATLAAVASFRHQNPHARVFFSQSTGEIMWIDGGGQALASGGASTSEEAVATVAGFLDRYPSLFRIDHPAQALKPVSDGSGYKRAPESRGATIAVRFEQTHDGILVRGKFGVATFDSRGGLLALETRLVPSSQLEQQPQGSGSPAIGTTSQALTIGDAPTERPLSSRIRVMRARRVLDTVDGETYQVMQEKLERRKLRHVRAFYDAQGALLEEQDETPSTLVQAPQDWITQGQLVTRTAPDVAGAAQAVSSTAATGALVLGFSIEGIHAGGAAAVISDAALGRDKRFASDSPIATDAADWTTEPAYSRDATELARNVETTLRWYKDTLGHASWDGAGAPLYASIRGNRRANPTEPDLNAYGADGYLLIGDGHTASGHTLGDALEVVAHEFTHSVINATADFEYRDESGALNESLCDVMGMAAMGFASTVYGQGIGYPQARDLLHPENLGQPASYGEFETRDHADDNGGVHFNSGIVNRALTQVIASAPGGASAGAVPMAALILDSLRDHAYSASTNLEEFAAGLSSYCRARERSGSLWQSQQGLCEKLETSFADTELLRKI